MIVVVVVVIVSLYSLLAVDFNSKPPLPGLAGSDAVSTRASCRRLPLALIAAQITHSPFNISLVVWSSLLGDPHCPVLVAVIAGRPPSPRPRVRRRRSRGGPGIKPTPGDVASDDEKRRRRRRYASVHL